MMYRPLDYSLPGAGSLHTCPLLCIAGGAGAVGVEALCSGP